MVNGGERVLLVDFLGLLVLFERYAVAPLASNPFPMATAVAIRFVRIEVVALTRLR